MYTFLNSLRRLLQPVLVFYVLVVFPDSIPYRGQDVKQPNYLLQSKPECYRYDQTMLNHVWGGKCIDFISEKFWGIEPTTAGPFELCLTVHLHSFRYESSEKFKIPL